MWSRNAWSPLTSRPSASLKGRYYSVVVGEKRAAEAAWHYPDPEPPFDRIKGYVAFYAGLMDACMVDEEMVIPQPGGYYGGWITSDVAGPFKGEPGASRGEEAEP